MQDLDDGRMLPFTQTILLLHQMSSQSKVRHMYYLLCIYMQLINSESTVCTKHITLPRKKRMLFIAGCGRTQEEGLTCGSYRQTVDDGMPECRLCVGDQLSGCGWFHGHNHASTFTSTVNFDYLLKCC